MWGTFGPKFNAIHRKFDLGNSNPSACMMSMKSCSFHMEEYLEYQEKRAFHCLHASTPKLLNRVNNRWPTSANIMAGGPWLILNWSCNHSYFNHNNYFSKRINTIIVLGL